MIKVVFVCHGNICRSPMAEAICKDIVKKKGIEAKFIIDSMAVSKEEIGNNIYYKTNEILEKHHIYGFNHYAKQITANDYDFFDYVFVMDRFNISYLKNIMGFSNLNKVRLLGSYLEEGKEIEDPWYTRNFENVYQQIYLSIVKFIDEVENELSK